MTVTPYALKTCGITEPLGLDLQPLTFSWRLASERSGDAPSTHRVVVTDSTTEAEVWRSDDLDGVVTAVDVAGQAELAPLTRYRWSVTVVDERGGHATAESWFETGLLRSAPHGSWVRRRAWTDRTYQPPTGLAARASMELVDPAPYLRRTFTLDTKPVWARLLVSSRGLHRPFLNGRRVGDDELAPGWTDYHRGVTYRSHDVTHLVHEGENAVGLMLGEGWWSGYVGLEPRKPALHYGSRPEGWAQLVVRDASGAETVLATDGDWKVASGAIVFDDLLMGERFEPARDPEGWTTSGFDDSGWDPVEVGERPTDLLAVEDEPIRVIDVLPVVASTSGGPATRIYDFGQNLVGRVRVRFEPAEGALVCLRYAEALDESGRLYTENLRRAEATDEYVLDPQGGVFESVFTSHGFRYLEISGCVPPADGDVTAHVLSNDLEQVGSFRCSDPDVNRLYENIRWGQRGNYLAVPTDCPQRDERLGWLGDAQVFLSTATYNADVQAFFRRWLRDVRFAQSDEGAFADIAPLVGVAFVDAAPAWGDAGVIIPWHLYRTYGDEGILRDSIGSMIRWVDFVAVNNPDGIWRRRVGNNYGDWLQLGAQTPTDLLATAFHHHSARLTAQAAEVLGDLETAARLTTLADRIRDAFRAEFADDDLHLGNDTQTAYLLAIAFGLARDARDEARWGEHLAAAVERNDGLLTTGFIGVAHLLPVLQRIGRADLALALLRDDRYPGWLYSVKRGATTIWERWDGWTEEHGFQSPSMNSFNHYSLGSVGEWLYSGIGGIRQSADSIAYRDLVIAPQMGGGLTSAETAYESPRGRIATAWSLEDGVVTLDVEIPPGPPASVELPVDAGSARLDGAVIPATAGALDAGQPLVFACPPGTHRIHGVLASARSMDNSMEREK